MSVLNPITITARDLPDAWAQCVFKILEPGIARKRQVSQGSFEGEFRLEFDYVTVHVLYPGTRPLIPDIPAHLGIPAPVESMNKVETYFARYLMSDCKEGNEQYTYGERIVSSSGINQIDEIIKRYRNHGPGNNQLIIQVAQPSDLTIQDPPCLRHIDTRIESGRLHFMIYFRSWDLWGGFPENLAGLQLLKEYMAGEIGVEDGEMICSSKGLHLYGYTWEIARIRRGLTEAEMSQFLNGAK